MGINYSVEADPDTTAKAMLRERQVSLKHSKAVARELKGMTAGDAVDFLEGVVEGEEVVPVREHNAGVGHKKNIDGWDAGRFPEKPARAFIELVENAIGNADHQGFDAEAMEIMHVAPHKVGESRGRKPRAMGRASEWNTTEIDVELVLEEPDAGGED